MMYDSIGTCAIVLGTHFGQVTFIALLAIAATRFLKSKPYLCYGFLMLAILKCLTPPFLPGYFELEIPDSQTASVATNVSQTPATETQPLAVEPQIDEGPTPQVWNSKPPTQSGVKSRNAPRPAVVPGNIARNRSASKTPIALGPDRQKSLANPTIATQWILLASYLLVSVGLFAIAIWHSFRLTFRMQCTTEIDQNIAHLFGSCMKTIGIEKVQLVVTTNDMGPLAFGMVKPTVAIPESMTNTCSQTELETVFLHELTHLKRKDVFFGWLQTIAVCLWWINPVVWYLSACLSRWREYCCDLETMTAQNISSKDYCLRLLNTSSHNNKYLFPVRFGVSTFLRMEQRMKILMRNSNSTHRGMSGKLKIAMILTACFVLPNFMGFGKPTISTTPEDDSYRIFYSSKNGTIELTSRNNQRTTVFAVPQNVSHGKVSPDGKAFAFVSWIHGQRKVWVCERDGKPKPISPDHGQEFIQQIEWSPNGKTLAYRTQGSLRSAVYIVHADGSNHRKLKPFGKNLRGLQYYNDFCWSPDGKSLALAKVVEIDSNHFADMITVTRKSVLQIHEIKSNQRRELFHIGKRMPIHNLNWSPDGKTIAFKSKHDLYVQQVTEKTTMKKLASQLNPDGVPKWSNDSQTILVHSANGNSPARPGTKNRKHKTNMLLVRLDGKPTRKVPLPFGVFDYDWDGSGETIICAGSHGQLVRITVGEKSHEILAEDVGFYGKVQIRKTAPNKEN